MRHRLDILIRDAEEQRNHWLTVYEDAPGTIHEDAMRGFLKLAADYQAKVFALEYLREHYT